MSSAGARNASGPGEEAGIRVEREGPVTTILIDRPRVRNALDGAAVEALGRAFRAFEADPEAAVAVLHGCGGSFCAGADLGELAARRTYEPWAGSLEGMLGRPLGKPLIGAVAGHAVAGGLGLALYCDIRIADPTAVFGVFCRRFGVPMSDGTTVRLPRVVGEGRALELMLTGRPVGAREALAIGLVNELVEEGGALARACELARALAAFPQRALRSDRLSLLESRGLALGPALENEARRAEEAKRTDAVRGALRFAGGAGRHGEGSLTGGVTEGGQGE